MTIIRYRYVFLIFSSLLVIAGVAALALWGLKFGIDFTGGSLMEVSFSGARPSADAIHRALAPLDLGSVVVQPTGDAGMLLRFKDVDEATHQRILAALKGIVAKAEGSGVAEKRFDAVGPVIGTELYRRSLMAIVLTVLAIVIYIAWAFRHISKPVASWKYGVAVIVALIHDIVIPVGVFAALGHFSHVEIDVLFITALLTVLGFSVHDTIVVFDRIRENLHETKGRESYADTVGRSITETLARSIFTSFTVLLVLAAVLLFGGTTTQYFALALIIGVAAGTYSSIFVASPLLVVWQSLTQK